MSKKPLLLAFFITFLGFAHVALAETITLTNPLCPNGSGSAGCINSIPTLITQVTSYISTVIGILAVLMFVISGILFVLSAGDPGKIQKAKDIAIWAAVGVGISLLGAGLVAVVTAVIGATPT